MEHQIDISVVNKDIEQLIEQGLYFQSLELAQRHWGPYQSWWHPDQLLLGGTIFAGLGLRRKALAMRFVAWRRAPQDPAAIYAFVSGQLERQGPLQALELIRRFPRMEADDLTRESRAEWLALKANVYSQYRDWETANSLLAQALQLAPDLEWLHIEKAVLLEAQDDYIGAWQTVCPLIDGNNRNAILFGAHLKTLANEREDAIAILQGGMAVLESISIALRLARLYQDGSQWDRAQACLERARSLLPEGCNLDHNLAIAAYEQALADDRLQDAAQALEPFRSGFYKSIRDNLEVAGQKDKESNPLKKVLLDVPFVRQHHMTCAPATLSSLFRYWGQEADHLGIVEAICYDGTPNHAERRWALQQGWKVREFRLQEETAWALIDRGVPFTLSTVDPGSAHLQAVVGYDRRNGLYLVRDPYYPSIQEFLAQETGECYRSSGPRCLALVPADKAHLLEGIEFPEADLYDAYYHLQEALDQHQRKKAETCLQTMQQQQGGHRLTLMAERSLARYDGDELRELRLIEQLLEQFPDDLNLQVAKANVLGYLARNQDKIEYLEQQVERAQPNPHPLLVEQLASVLVKDHRRGQQAAEHLQYVLYRQPTNAVALWMLANTHWDLSNRDLAFEYYRLCSTLQDKNEHYVSSFFRAARYLKQTDRALQRLQQRVDELGKKSIYPWESLYFAFRELSRDQDGILTLEQAIALHPDNSVLIGRLARAYLGNGRVNDAIRLCNAKKAQLSELDRLHLAADVASYRNQWQQQVDYQHRILKRQPLNHYVIDSQATLLGRHQGDQAALDFIDDCLRLNPRDRELLFLRLDWMYDQPAAERERFNRTIAELHPRDGEAHVRLARVQQQQRLLPEAERSAQEACDINPYDQNALITLADIQFQQEKTEQALEGYRKVLQRSVDCDGLFPRLLRCCPDFESKQAQLRQIHQALMEQTSYGNGILEYRDVARALIQDEEVLSFLEQACDLRPDLWQSWVTRAMQLSAMDRLDEAKSIIAESRRRFPLLPRVYLESARILYVAREFDAAQEEVQEALRHSPQWMSAITQSIMILEAQNRHEEALKQIQGYLLHMPTSAVLHGYLTDTLAQLGRREEAIGKIEQALRLDATYEWAWDRFEQLTRNTEQSAKPLQLAAEILEKEPHNVVVWQKCIELEPDFDAKMKLMDQALALHPRHEDLNLLMCTTLFDAHQIQQVHQLVHHEKWKGNPPSSLLGFEAWMEAKYQRFEQAIEGMTAVVERDPYYYDGWRLLAQWAQDTGQYERAVQHVNTCVRLSPHAPGTLTMAAEVYLEAVHDGVKVDESRIGQCLEKAVVLDPRNQYNGLTWLDYLIEQKDWLGVHRARSIIHNDEGNPYYLVRYLQAAIRDSKLAVASELFDELIRYPQDNEWLYETVYREYAREELWNALRDRLQQYLNDPQSNPMIGRLWAQFCLDHEPKRKTLLKYLEPFEPGTDRWREAMEAVFAREEDYKSGDLVIRQYRETLLDDPRVWSLVTFHYTRRRQWGSARRWCARHWKRPDNNAWAVYLHGYGLRLDGKWKQAMEVNDYAAQLPADDYYDRIILWQLYAGSVVGNEVLDEDQFARIRFDELAALEQYLFRLVAMLLQTQQQGVQATLKKIKSVLRQARKQHPDVANSNVAQKVNQDIRRRVVAGYDGNLLQKGWLMFQLFLLR